MDLDIVKLFEKITWKGARNVLIIIVILAVVGVGLYKELKPEEKKGPSHDMSVTSGTGGTTHIEGSTVANGDVNNPQKEASRKADSVRKADSIKKSDSLKKEILKLKTKGK